jgi:hypothetical protein
MHLRRSLSANLLKTLKFFSNLLINPTIKYVAFSQSVSVRSKASKRRFSHSKASFDNDAAGRHALALLIS